MIGVDWGTTHLRAYRIDTDGLIIAARTEPKGIMTVGPGEFGATLEAVAGDWFDLEDEPFILSGMIGSRQGWVEVPYVPCPVHPAQVAQSLRAVTCAGRRGFICPGLSCLDPDGVPDVLRGEEVQIFGALTAVPLGPAAVCHPGTHSKHVRVHDGRVVGFSTSMTGEVFGVLRQFSILGRTIDPGPTDWQAFDDGVWRARKNGGMLHHLFGTRTRVLAGDLPPTSAADYLSGMLIGHELAAAGSTGPVLVVAAAELEARYLRAFHLFGTPATAMSGETAAGRGLRLIHDLARDGRP